MKFHELLYTYIHIAALSFLWHLSSIRNVNGDGNETARHVNEAEIRQQEEQQHSAQHRHGVTLIWLPHILCSSILIFIH